VKKHFLLSLIISVTVFSNVICIMTNGAVDPSVERLANEVKKFVAPQERFIGAIKQLAREKNVQMISKK
jgi:hypothetical protein